MITCIGNIIADVLISPFERMPKSGELIMVDDIILSVGGCAANPAVILGKVGMDVSLMGGVGDDGLKKFLFGEFQRAGVKTGGIRSFPGISSSVTIVCIDASGERSFMTQMGASKRYDLSDVDWGIISESSHLHYGGYFTVPNLLGETAACLFRRAKEMGLITSLDTAWDCNGRWMADLSDALPFTDFFMTNRDEGRQITGKARPEDIAKSLHDAGANGVIVKLDKDGCYISSGELKSFIPTYPSNVVDSTGAGDAFAAGFLVGHSSGLTLEKCCRLGNVFGVLCIRAIGATEGIRCKEDVLRFIEDNEHGLVGTSIGWG